jgi:hypothetical protein
MPEFIPDTPTMPESKVPFFEDITARDVPGRGVEKPIEFYQKRIEQLLLKLGGGFVAFIPGRYPGKPTRYGYQITFSLNGIPGRFDAAALPMRSETPKKKDRALAQALYLVGLWLEAEVYSQVYRPGSIPLIPYLIGAGGKTVTEELVERRVLPDIRPMALPDGK